MTYLTTLERFAIQRGQLRMAREVILEVLDVRFEGYPASISEQLEQINDLDRLKQLLRQAVIVESIAVFAAGLTVS